MIGRDPLADPAPLIRQVYAYVSYRIDDRAEADDATSETFERAVRYRDSYAPSRGKPIAWLLGIARHVLADRRRRPAAMSELAARPSGDLETETVDRIVLRSAISRLSERDRELLALRYGADLKVSEIGVVLEMSANAVKVALHRAVDRLRRQLQGEEAGPLEPARETVSAL